VKASLAAPILNKVEGHCSMDDAWTISLTCRSFISKRLSRHNAIIGFALDKMSCCDNWISFCHLAGMFGRLSSSGTELRGCQYVYGCGLKKL